MELLPDRSFVQSPGTCIVCELSPDEGTPVVDTGKNLTLGIPSLDGRKYVCKSCGTAVANALGFVSEEAEQAAKQAAADAQAQFEALKAKVDSVFADVTAVVETPVVAENVAVEEVEEVVEDDEPEADEEDEDA